jgi:toxin HigB-1
LRCLRWPVSSENQRRPPRGGVGALGGSAACALDVVDDVDRVDDQFSPQFASVTSQWPWGGLTICAGSPRSLRDLRSGLASLASLRAFFVEDRRSRNIPSDLESRLFRKLQMIDDATTDQDLRVPPSNHFEKLRGHLAGFHSVRVNKQWRLVFRWDGSRGEANGVYLDDHSYR